MVFSSHLFVFYFLPVALGSYYLLPRRGRHLALTLLSYLFYGWANYYFVPLMLFSTSVDYLAGRYIASRSPQSGMRLDPDGPRGRAQKSAVAVSVAVNLGLLGFFKYFNFGVDSYNALCTALGMDSWRWDALLQVTLPLGISFYTFQSISYTVDVYRGRARAVANFIDFACYVSLFPQLVAGPIIRFHEIARQLRSRRHTLVKFGRGVAFFSLGMAKKVLLANPCGRVADLCFEAGSRGWAEAWYGLLAYAFQIYFDFSGYSDMAVGLGLMLGFVFPRNFRHPYRADSVTDLWRRWHMSLSRWLRDYLYIPLGGSRKGAARTYVNLALVMILGGLWHGAGWTFAAWGAYHGALLMAERAAGPRRLYGWLPRRLRVAAVFALMCLSWVPFRAPDAASAARYFADMAGLGEAQAGAALLAGIVYQPYYLLTLLAAAWAVWLGRDTWEYTRVLGLPKAAFCLLLLAASLTAMTAQSYNPFIYFIF